MASPRTRTAAIGSMFCQKRWLGSKLAADGGTGDGAELSMVSGLYSDEAGVHLDGDADAVVGGELAVRRSSRA